MLVNDRPPKQAFRPQYKIKRFADCRLPYIVPANKESMTRKIDASLGHAPKILDIQASYPHIFSLVPYYCQAAVRPTISISFS